MSDKKITAITGGKKVEEPPDYYQQHCSCTEDGWPHFVLYENSKTEALIAVCTRCLEPLAAGIEITYLGSEETGPDLTPET